MDKSGALGIIHSLVSRTINNSRRWQAIMIAYEATLGTSFSDFIILASAYEGGRVASLLPRRLILINQ